MLKVASLCDFEVVERIGDCLDFDLELISLKMKPKASYPQTLLFSLDDII